jgi:hypothetical protein
MSLLRKAGMLNEVIRMDPGGTGLVSSWEKTPERILFCAM